ncbi:MAG: sigma-70 family RNA polymerase sigma factor [Armatimonadetes bacterium]|nr:sigma-70 family RNA polymerase sigma factor [Armatimonadota bacterium]
MLEQDSEDHNRWGGTALHARRLERLALRLCQGDSESACDLAHQAMANAAGKDGLDQNRDLWPYLRTSLVHLFIDRLRLQKRELPLEAVESDVKRQRSDGSEPGQPDGQRLIEARFLRQRVGEVMAHLPEPQAEVLRLVYSEGYSLEEIGQKLGLTQEAVKQRLKRARGRFRSVCEKMEVVFE